MRERKKRQPRHTCCSAVLHLNNPSTTTTIMRCASLDANATHWHAVYLGHAYGTYKYNQLTALWAVEIGGRPVLLSVEQGQKMLRKVGVQVPQFVPMQQFFFSSASWHISCSTCSAFLRSLKPLGSSLCIRRLRIQVSVCCKEARHTRGLL